MESQSGLRLLDSGERNLATSLRAAAAAPLLCFAINDARAGALEVRAWGERVVFVVRPRGCVIEEGEGGLVLDDGGDRVFVRWTLPRTVRLPSFVGKRVRIEHRVEMHGGSAGGESLVIVETLGNRLLLAAHEGSIDRAPSAFPIELHGRGIRASTLERRRTHDITVLAISGRACAFVATPKLP